MKKLDTYFKQSFPNQLRLLSFQKPNRVVSEQIMNDPHVLFFGGKNWKRVESDLGNIPENHRLAFILCLFMITISDQNLYRYFKDSYTVWRNHTQFPKFGWSGFGPHHENPMKILTVPEEQECVTAEGNEQQINQFSDLFFDQAEDVIERYQIELSTNEFFEKMTNDPDYISAEGRLAELVKNQLKEKVNHGYELAKETNNRQGITEFDWRLPN